jgi:hypothetical protein
MGSTFHEQGLEEAFDKFVIEEPQAIELFVGVRKRLKQGFYEPDVLVDALMSTHRPTMEEVFGFCRAWERIKTGQFAITYLTINEEPYADSAHELNQRLLDTIQQGFTAEVVPQRGRSANDDGQVCWKEPFDTTDANGRPWKVRPGRAPLEIGSTKISRTLLHFVQERCLARWPYGHNQVVLFTATEQFDPPNIFGPRK